MTFSIIGTGSKRGSKIVSNHDFEKVMDTTDAWIKEKTGIKTRHMLDSENLIELARVASINALEMANIKAEELDLIICATVGGDYRSPSMACIVQKEIGAKCPAFDINAGCSGFIYGLSIAEKYFKDEKNLKILMLSAEAISQFINMDDRSTAVLFGDAAGAVVLGKGDGLKALKVKAKGNVDYLNIPAHEDVYVHMQGQKVFQFAVGSIKRDIKEILKLTGMELEEIDYYLLHQANMRIMDFAAQKLHIANDKLLSNIETLGNTSAASIPVLLDENIRNGTIKKGDKLVLSAFGAGLTSGSAMIVL